MTRFCGPETTSRLGSILGCHKHIYHKIWSWLTIPMANHCQAYPHLSITLYIQNDYNIMLKIYISHFRMAIQICTIPKGTWPTSKRVVLYMPFQSSTKSVPKGALIVWTTSTSTIPSPIADEPKSIKQRIKETE